MTSSLFTVVLCDDEASIVKELQEAIDWNKIGISVIGTADNGTDALNLIIQDKPDIAIIDINMPGINGIELLRRARNAQVDTDFIILSGYDDFTYAKEAIRMGVRAYLLKPLNISELNEELFRILNDRSRNSSNGAGNAHYRQEVLNNFFRNMIDGKILEQAVINVTLQQSDINITESTSFVLVFSWPEKNALDEITQKRILHYFDDKFSDRCYFFFYNSTQLIGIFNVMEEPSFSVAERALSFLTAGINDLSFGVLPNIGIGDTVPSLMNVQYSYTRALTALTYKLYGEDSHIFSYNMICTIPPKMRLSDLDYLPLVQCIVKKDLQGINAYCDEFMDKLLYVKMPSPNYVYSTCYALFNLIEKEFSNYSHEEIRQIESPNELYQFHSIKEIKEWLINSFCRLSEFIDAVYGYSDKIGSAPKDELKTEDDDEIIARSKQFIHNNIANNLKIEDIARGVNLSASYFAIYFKNKTNVNLRDYILREKMEYARKALLDSNASVTDIAYQTGYRDYRSFSRAFKNIHGVTPSDFQQKHSL